MVNKIKIQWAIFDLGGVILNFKGSFASLAAALDKPQALLEQAYYQHATLAACGRISTTEFWARIRQDLHLLDGTIADYEEFWTDHFAAIPQTHALLRELAGNYRLGIMSNTEFGVYERALRKAISLIFHLRS